ncbi:ATP-binding protein [Psychromonas ossibalaenae]|uniref:ATP-binding protein n=1 Tax=Psychromonas ossibalaenae TaxID=444922 RepID=UPI0012F998E0|nr:ATP-binding protein [Psychromonas ossibalaenae]
MKLLHKFFLAFFISNLAVVILLLTAISLSLSSDFNELVNKAEDKHLQETLTQLSTSFQQSNSWQAIINDVQIWRDIVDPGQARRPLRPPRDEPPRDQRRQNRREDNPPPNERRPRQEPRQGKWDTSAAFLKTGQRMSLYDSSKNVIVGRKELSGHSRIEPVISGGKTVGWVGLAASNALEGSPAAEFLQQQFKTYFLIAGIVLLISVITAIMLAKHLTAPIKQLISATGRLRNGDYSSRINSSSKDEIGILSENYNDLANTLEKNQHSRRQWMSDTSHELRTPLTVIKSQLIAIQDGVLKAGPEKLQMLVEEVDKLSRIVADLYQLSSSDIGALTYKKIKLDPLKLLNQTLDNFQVKFAQRQLTLSRSAQSDTPCFLFADKDRLLQLFSNLFENSCRYTDLNGKIHIVTRIDGTQLQIQIQDSAPGLAETDMSKIFERFYRVEKSRSRAHGGSGLGLALCSQIVKAHQGTITAQNSPLGGITIIITLPVNLGAQQ